MSSSSPAPASPDRPSGLDIYRPMRRSALVVVALFVVGVIGYELLGIPEHGWLDAVYMTVITLTTTGYHEVVELHDSPIGKVFTSLLLLAGVGSLAYFFSNLTAFMVEGELQRVFWRRRMSRAIEALSDHVIVCGAGHTGEHVLRELAATRRACVLVESGEQRVTELCAEMGEGLLAVVGDAGDDEVLRRAGIERASGLVACVSSDKDNLIVVVSARILNPKMRIVSRCIDEKVERKIRRAGADAIVSPNRIGGLRLISELVRPHAVSYLDLMLRDTTDGLRVESTPVAEGSELAGLTVAELRARHLKGLSILALRDADGSWHHAPEDEERLGPGWSVVYVGPPAAREALEKLARP
jgi:voltage-gated potassium channel